MFKKMLFASLSFFFILTQINTYALPAADKTYGFCIRNLIPDQPIDPQLQKIEAIAKISLEWLGNEMEGGELVWQAKTFAEAKRIQGILVKAGYKVDVIEVIFYDEPNANVLSAQMQMKIAEQLLQQFEIGQ